MNPISYMETYNKIFRKITNTKWLKKHNINKYIMDKNIKSSKFKDTLKNQINNKDFSAKSTIKLCNPMLDALSEHRAPDNWLLYLYQYTLRKNFPENATVKMDPKLTEACELYLTIFNVLCEIQKSSQDGTWESHYPLQFLTLKEESELEHPEEYKKFIKSFSSQCTYEMMKMNGEITGFTTLEHICGVHYLSLCIARQLKSIDIPVDLGRVSGAAAGHDIGKYGCKYIESKRVPHLHYYYTDQWFKRCGINYIRNIAINHSVWDLELENLSLESLLLIYSDFRIKNASGNGKSYMKLFSLDESFYIISDKLENMNLRKSKRYKRVYAKLKDFENFLLDMGIDIDPKQTCNFVETKIKNYTLLQGNDIVQNLKYLSINHNINLMYQLRDEYSLDAILEMTRSENDWKVFREYIRIFQEYSTYLTQKQKLQTLKFLYENLIHPEDDIRRHCAELMGTLIATFDEDYRKELPLDVKIPPPITSSTSLLKKYMDIMLSPSYKIISAHKFNIGYSISIMINSLFTNCKESFIVKYIDVLLGFFKDEKYKGTNYEIFLLETSKYIPWNYLSKENEEILFSYIFFKLKKRNSTTRMEALEIILVFSDELLQKRHLAEKIKNYFNSITTRSKISAENFLLYKINKKLNLADNKDIFKYYCDLNPKVVTGIFLSNLKTDTDWIRKKNQVELLLYHALDNPQSIGLHTAIHFCNLLKVSAIESVRNTAGAAILKIMPYLSLAERNEVAVELLRALEIEGNRFTEYIPRYTGQAALWLQPKELDEFIDDSIYKIKTSNSNLKSLIFKTVGTIISHYQLYNDRFEETESTYLKRLNKMLGILLNGLGDYNPQVKQSAFSVIGKEIFDTPFMDLTKKELIFKLIAKKVLTLITDNENQEILFLTRSASLNHIYRFISDFNFFYGDIDIPVPSKIAFFPGTFDPFSLSHKEIAKYIRDLGFEVYLAIDEFSWSKKTLPNLLRRNIVTMSIASELNIYVYPDMYPTNISNRSNLKTLRENFPDSKVYMCIGSDVLLNASSYKAPKTRNSIHTFSHIIFERGKDNDLKLAAKKIEGNVIVLSLTSKYSSISSSQIRTSIDDNRDISTLVDPMAEQYIYANGFYQMESQDKYSISSLWLDSEIFQEFNDEVLRKISQCIPDCTDKFIRKVKEISLKPSFCIVFLKNTNTEEILGFCILHWIHSSTLYDEFKSTIVSQYIRENSTGRIISIDGICIKDRYKSEELSQILLTEAISLYVSKDYEYAVYRNAFNKELCSKDIFSLLKLYGFTEVPFCDDNNPVYAVNMSTPSIINFDIQNIIKEPFRSNPKIMETLTECRKKLIEGIAKLHPGELIISFNVNFVYQCLIRKICKENMVPTDNLIPRKLGEAMCVPYGNILERYVIPNTVTKALHTEKLFFPDMRKFIIGEFPHCLNLSTQIKMIKAFQRPVILVDDLLHKGYRIKAVDPILKHEDIEVKKIIVAVLSGRGKDLMDMQGRSVESVYFIPRLKLWFNENSLYPFIGGDALFRGSYPERNLLPSINLILPYTYPAFIRNTPKSNIYNLSKTCLENSLNILETIEKEYHIIHEKNLTLSSLGQVFAIPRCPDLGENISYNLNLPASSYIKNDLELLIRMNHAFE